ncbi:FAD-dependent oxidoreductase [Actinomadura flavalba]|uniref:FAD-dependent oxidoreductase n=1 Tax=Actinomadura flavalba TaxID=1120938 RepID=UPI000369C976|nr:FAD-dependent oxidoreductase [Actinomadura flavalba]
MTQGAALDAVVVGAGPYGLSVGAHLRGHGAEVRVIGTPMAFWADQLPIGMRLKSEPFASSLGAPRPGLTFPEYAPGSGIGDPIPLDTFVAYGRWFAERCAPRAEETLAERIAPDGDAYRVELATGESVRAANVVVAVGVALFAHRPAELDGLPRELASHTVDHHDLGVFRGKSVAIVGAGQSAIETAVLLAENGAQPTVVARGSELVWNAVPQDVAARGLSPAGPPVHGLGRGYRTWIYSEYPQLTRLLPAATRRRIVRTTMGPAGSWWLRDRFDGVEVLLGRRVVSARERSGQVVLRTSGRDGTREVVADHVIAATGYVPDLDRMTVLTPELRATLARRDRSPRLDRGFQTSASGLYVTGLPAAASFGPVMRFVHGSAFAADRIARHLVARSGGTRRTSEPVHA